MTREEKNELLTQLGSEDYEAYMELRRQMELMLAQGDKDWLRSMPKSATSWCCCANAAI